MSTSAADGDPWEVLALRRAIYGKGDATRADLEILIARGGQGGADPEFCNLIAEVAADVLVRQVDPAGYVTEADAATAERRRRTRLPSGIRDVEGDFRPCRERAA